MFARGTSMRYAQSNTGNLHLHLLPAFGRRMWVFFFISWMLPYFVLRYRATHLLAQCPVLGGLAATFCAKVFQLPLFVELHGGHYFGRTRPGWRGTFEHWLYRTLSLPAFFAAKRIRTLSDDMTDRFVSVYGNRFRGKLVTVPTRVDLAVFTACKVEYRVGDPLRIITVGAFSPLKNHLQLIKDLHFSGIPFRLTLVGSGTLGREYKSAAEFFGIAHAVIVTGGVQHRDLSPLLAAHDVYVHYSLSEGLSRAILEAMATALPVVVTRVGFIGGVLRDGYNALILDSPSSEHLVKALNRLLSSEALRRQIGQAARQTIEQDYESGKVFEQYRSMLLG